MSCSSIKMNMRSILPLSLLLALSFCGFDCGREAPESAAIIPPTTQSLSLIASHPLGAFAAEPSAIAYAPRSNSFFIVSDSHPMIYEIDLSGNLLRSISIGSSDLEGIAVSNSGDTIFVAEEKSRTIALYDLTGKKLSSFPVDVATVPNNALEGVTAGRGSRLFVLNEKLPGMMIECTPSGTELRRTPLSFAADYSDIYCDTSAGSLWFISDESMKVVKTTMDAVPVSQWSVPFTKGEGISIVRDTVYIVNDADARLYVFRKPK
jgi:uncharacterized protein YjiK